MTDEFDSIKAPRFYDFTVGEDDSDSYFDELEATDPLDSTGEQEKNERFYTPGKQMRRSMSQGDVHFLQNALQGLLIYRNNEEYQKHINAEHEDAVESVEDPLQNAIETVKKPIQNTVETVKDPLQIDPKKEKEKAYSNGKVERTSRYQVRCNTTRHKTASLDRLQALSKPKYLPHNKGRDYVPMAEMISKIGGHFREGQASSMWNRGKPKPTNPHTPKLLTTGRSRPVHVESAAEKELKQVEEMQRFKFRAKPVNEKVIHGPVKAVHLEKKPATVSEPFHLTEIKHKPIEEPNVEVPEFHAKPVPKSVLEGPKKVDVPLKVTIPQTPQFMRKYLKEHPTRKTPSQEGNPKGKPSPAFHNKRTQPVPFSFEVRDQMLKRKKERMIEKVYEEMKKAREFHARPVPKAILEDNKKGSSSSTKSLKSSCESLENGNACFRARPATVLKQRPFVPKKPSLEEKYTRPMEFQLNTDKRAVEREEFERSQREKEELREQLRKEDEERRRKEEEELVERQRREAEFKARPVRKYKALELRPSPSPLTEPQSPNFAYKKTATHKDVPTAASADDPKRHLPKKADRVNGAQPHLSRRSRGNKENVNGI